MPIRSLPRPASALALALATTAAAAAAPARPADVALTTEIAKQATRAELERRIGAHLGQRIALVESRPWGHFGLKAVVRLPAHAEGGFCSAAQLSMTLMPEPGAAPSGTRPGAIHASRLPLKAGETKAAQVYRFNGAALAGWRRLTERDPCATIDLARPFFAADSAEAAGRSLALFDRLVGAAAEQGEPLRLDCGARQDDSCREAFAALRAEEILAVTDRCAAPGAAAVDPGRCVRIDLDPDRIGNGECFRTLTILVGEGRRDSPAIARAWLSSHCVVA